MTVSKEQLYSSVIEKYNKIHFQNEENSWFIFMNDGYMPLEDGYPTTGNFPVLNDLHKMWKYQSYLYIQLLQEANLNFDTALGNILDIGCGRGGGLSVYRDYFKTKSLTGLDINPKQIEFANNTFNDIKFVQGSAMDMPFEPETFDIITNVESANYYVYYDDFLTGINKILKKDGIFLYADTFNQERMFWVEKSLELHNLKVISKRNITENVRAACALDKYRLLNYSRSLADVMLWDEERYYAYRNNNDHYTADYYIMVISKN